MSEALAGLLKRLEPLIPPPRPPLTAAPSLGRSFLPGGKWILDTPPGVPAIWGDGDEVLWAKGEALVIAGSAGVGKSFLCAQLVLARIGLRSDLLGYPVASDDRPLLYLASDRPQQIKRLFGLLVDPADRDRLDRRLIVWEGPPENDFAKDPGLLLRMCQETGAGTVVLDSLKDMAIGLAEEVVAATLNRAIQLVIAAGIEVLSLHHLTKSGSEEAPSLHKIFGSAWIVNGAGSVILIQGSAGAKVVVLNHVKQPAEVVGPLNLEHDHAGGISRLVGAIDYVAIVAASSVKMTARDVAEQAFGTAAPTEAQKRKCSRRLDAAVKRGALEGTPAVRGGPGGTTPATYWAKTVAPPPP